MAIGRPGNRFVSRPSGKVQRDRFPETSSGAVAPSDATIVPSGLKDTKPIQPNLSVCHPTPTCFTNLRNPCVASDEARPACAADDAAAAQQSTDTSNTRSISRHWRFIHKKLTLLCDCCKSPLHQ